MPKHSAEKAPRRIGAPRTPGARRRATGDVVAPRTAPAAVRSLAVGAASAPAAPRSPFGLIRGAKRALAMVAVTFVFASSVGSMIPSAEAAPTASEQVAAPRSTQSLGTVSGTVTAAALSRDDYGITVKPPPPPPPPPPPAPAAVPAGSGSGSAAGSGSTASRLLATPSTSTAALQWPQPIGTKMSSGFGPRSCSGCSSDHQGVDLNAPAGSPIWSMADGVVVAVNAPGYSAFGVHARIQHLIDGEVVTTLYAHMQTGSMPLTVGQTVTAGQYVGAMGCTGSCTGTHLHFEIHPGGGVAVDPVAWFNSRVS